MHRAGPKRKFPATGNLRYNPGMASLSGLTAPDPQGRSVYVETYGCQMNVADSELIQGVLTASGYTATDCAETADVILLNTCAIRERAEERVAQRVRHFIGARRGGRRVRIGLAGCMAQHHRDKLLATIPGLDFIVGPDGYRRLPELLEADHPATEVRLDRRETYEDIAPVRGEGVRAWLTIMRGCNRFCTFCVVPYVRGRERSLPAAVLIEEIRHAAQSGYKEIVLLGQTVNAYNDGAVDFGGLLRQAAAVPGIERVRFTSPHPADMTDSAIAAMRDCAQVPPYVHLPVQSGSDRILEAMDRGHTIAEYLDLVRRMRDAIPDLAVSTDIIVGYPGETEEDFEATSQLMEQVGYDHAFMFKYSRREATRAWNVEETVPEAEKGRRLTRLIDEQSARAMKINQESIGRTTRVLVECPAKRQPNLFVGKNPQFKTVVFEPTVVEPGDIVEVAIQAAGPHNLRGRQI
jgi:tRNA-2-methylthio-N6-dimethylallyladenosine synthase